MDWNILARPSHSVAIPRIDLACAAGWDITGKQSNHNQRGQYRAEDLSVSGHFANCRQMGNDPETGLEDINDNFRSRLPGTMSRWWD